VLGEHARDLHGRAVAAVYEGGGEHRAIVDGSSLFLCLIVRSGSLLLSPLLLLLLVLLLAQSGALPELAGLPLPNGRAAVSDGHERDELQVVVVREQTALDVSGRLGVLQQAGGELRGV